MATDKTSLGDRIKDYENNSRIILTKRLPVVIRLDGSHFHTYTRKFEKPYDVKIRDAFIYATKLLFEEVQGLKISYQQSDELTLLLTNYETLDTQSWFGNNIQKMASVSASIITAGFNKFMFENKFNDRLAYFDSRAFILPKEEVCNALLWRQNDATRNSISCLGQKHFSHKQLHKKNTSEVQEMLFQEKGINWNNEPTWAKRGYCMLRKSFEKEPGVIRTVVEPDFEIPIFSQDRDYINKFVFVGEE
jgi:tRNA(His) guanylyltransferase